MFLSAKKVVKMTPFIVFMMYVKERIIMFYYYCNAYIYYFYYIDQIQINGFFYLKMLFSFVIVEVGKMRAITTCEYVLGFYTAIYVCTLGLSCENDIY